MDAFPHRGHEDNHVSYGACAGANKPFENIRMRIGSGPGHIDADLIAGIMRNEQFFYKQMLDSGQDHYVRNHILPQLDRHKYKSEISKI